MRRRAARPVAGLEIGAGSGERGDLLGIPCVRRRVQSGVAGDITGRRSNLRAGDA